MTPRQKDLKLFHQPQRPRAYGLAWQKKASKEQNTVWVSRSSVIEKAASESYDFACRPMAMR